MITRSGFTLVEIMIVVAIIGILATMAIPLYTRAVMYSQMNACINNLRQIDGSKDRYAIENKKTAGDPVTMSDIWPYFIKQNLDTCPAGGSYDVKPVAVDPECSFGPTHTI